MFNAGQEVALRVIGEEDGKLDAGDLVLFYGQGVQGVVKTRYTDTNVYWLTYGGAAGLRMDTRASLASGTRAMSFLTSVKQEKNQLYDSSLPMLSSSDYDHWFAQLPITASGPGEYRLP